MDCEIITYYLDDGEIVTYYLADDEIADEDNEYETMEMDEEANAD